MGKPLIIKKKTGESKTLEAELSKLNRVMKILQLVQSQGGWDADKLARECGVGQRTIYRDIDLLQKAGVPVDYDDEQKCYRVRGDYYMPPVDLTFEEALAVIALGEQIGKDGQIPYTKAATQAVAKIRGRLPERIRRALGPLDYMVIRLGQTADTADADVYTKMQKALTQHHSLSCVYEGAEKRFTKKFVFRPYTLLFEKRAWYAVGYHGGHDEVRCLKLNRFIDVQELPEIPYEIPKDFSLKKHFGNAWRMIRGEKTYKVHLRFDAQFAEGIADTHWHETQETQDREDGSLDFHCKVDGLDEVVWWVLSMGPHCQVIEPKELADRVRQLAAETAGLYAAKE